MHSKNIKKMLLLVIRRFNLIYDFGWIRYYLMVFPIQNGN